MTDDGAVLYLQEPGTHVGIRSEHLVVRREGVEISRVPLAAVRQVVLFGNVQISTQAQHTLALHEIPVAFLTPHCRFVAALVPAPAKNMNLRRRQYEVFADPAQSLELAREVVQAGSKPSFVNQRGRSSRARSSNRDDDVGRPRQPRNSAAAAIAVSRPAARASMPRRRSNRCSAWRDRERASTSANSPASSSPSRRAATSTSGAATAGRRAIR